MRHFRIFAALLAVCLLAGTLAVNNATEAFAQTEQCLTGSYDSADEAKANFANDCGRPFENTTDFRCDWMDRWQCSGPGTSTGATPAPSQPAAPAAPVNNQNNSGSCSDGLGGSYDSPEEAKANYESDCGRPFENTSAFRCDWIERWQCSGPAASGSAQPAPEPPSAPSPPQTLAPVDAPTVADGRCAGGTYATAGLAKVNYTGDCGRPFENTNDFRCDWINDGWQCSGPSANGSTQPVSQPAPAPTPSRPLLPFEIPTEDWDPELGPFIPVPGFCESGLYDDAETAKANYRYDCDRPFEETSEFLCGLTVLGWQCYGPGNPSGAVQNQSCFTGGTLDVAEPVVNARVDIISSQEVEILWDEQDCATDVVVERNGERIYAGAADHFTTDFALGRRDVYTITTSEQRIARPVVQGDETVTLVVDFFASDDAGDEQLQSLLESTPQLRADLDSIDIITSEIDARDARRAAWFSTAAFVLAEGSAVVMTVLSGGALTPAAATVAVVGAAQWGVAVSDAVEAREFHITRTNEYLSQHGISIQINPQGFSYPDQNRRRSAMSNAVQDILDEYLDGSVPADDAELARRIEAALEAVAERFPIPPSDGGCDVCEEDEPEPQIGGNEGPTRPGDEGDGLRG